MLIVWKTNKADLDSDHNRFKVETRGYVASDFKIVYCNKRAECKDQREIAGEHSYFCIGKSLRILGILIIQSDQN